MKAFTPYLMFSEAIPQQGLYILSRHFRHSLLVLAFVVFMSCSALYDTMLWGLDFPGYILRVSEVPATTMAKQLRPDPTYVTHSRTKPGNIHALDLYRDLSEGLWLPGVYATLGDTVELGSPSVVIIEVLKGREKLL